MHTSEWDGSGYYGGLGNGVSQTGWAFEFFTDGTSEDAKELDKNGNKLGNTPDLIYNRPDLYRQYVNSLASVLREKFYSDKAIDMAVFDRMIDYATKHKVSMIGIINYEVSKISDEKLFFIANDEGLAPSDCKKYVKNTKNI